MEGDHWNDHRMKPSPSHARALLPEDAPADPLREPLPHRLALDDEDRPPKSIWFDVLLVIVWALCVAAVVAGLP